MNQPSGTVGNTVASDGKVSRVVLFTPGSDSLGPVTRLRVDVADPHLLLFCPEEPRCRRVWRTLSLLSLARAEPDLGFLLFLSACQPLKPPQEGAKIRV